GNNTAGFWMYDPALDSWHQKADVPLGASNKKVKGGADIVCHQGVVYLLKGCRNELLKYDVEADSWVSLGPAPLGRSGRDKYDKGSWLASDRAGHIYCHRAKYNELSVYIIASDSWRSLRSGVSLMGRLGRKKKSKDGGCGAWLTDSLYTLKGGNTQEFWQYLPESDSWNELDTMPAFGSTLKKKKVKGGGDLVAAAPGVLYALKGNKTNEFWKYAPYPAVARTSAPPTRGGVSLVTASVFECRLSVSPNSTRSGFATVRLNRTEPGGPALLSVFDAAGRCVQQSAPAAGTGQVTLDLRSLQTGVYVVRLSAGGLTAAQKLVVQR
ncbi:T9SS type A sorting domain-containing protein, partial [candidate division WOR-3 bacterium]|nr:T9SS type A sorting domain-containing protein [candidate division WOR-3 bacterium]